MTGQYIYVFVRTKDERENNDLGKFDKPSLFVEKEKTPSFHIVVSHSKNTSRSIILYKPYPKTNHLKMTYKLKICP